jgi:hypothetical protein
MIMRKKTIPILFVLAPAIFFHNTLLAQPQDDSQNDLLPRLEALEKRVDALSQELQALRQQVATSSSSADNAKNVENAEDALVLKNWEFREMQVKFNQFHALDLILYNGYDKTIREIDARLEFKNLLGEHVYSLRIAALGDEIAPGSTYTDRGTAANKRLFGKGAILEKISRDSVNAALLIRRIVFADGSVKEFSR